MCWAPYFNGEAGFRNFREVQKLSQMTGLVDLNLWLPTPKPIILPLNLVQCFSKEDIYYALEEIS